MAAATLSFSTPAQRLDTYFDLSRPRECFNDSDIEHIGKLLQHSGSLAYQNPRSYIVLRAIGELKFLDQLLQSGFSDSWFPVEESQLPGFLQPEVKAKIKASQHMVLTKSLDLENGKHCHFDSENQPPFEILICLGRGAYGQVDQIESKISHKRFALKRIRRRTAFGGKAKESMEEFMNEMEIMKTLKHRHIIEYIGSYTDRQHLGLVMSPVATCNLKTYTEQMCNAPGDYPLLPSCFGCLASALSYLHSRDVKHRDIKPQNILIHDNNVLIADFGLSRDFLDTTSGTTAASPRYCSPEVASYEKRNMSTDIWSLGCVYLEMVAALHGFSDEWLKNYYKRSFNSSSNYHANLEATAQLLREWEESWAGSDKEPLRWIRAMLVLERKARPTADEVSKMIVISGEINSNPSMFSGLCCVQDSRT